MAAGRLITGTVKYFDPCKHHGIVVPEDRGPEAFIYGWVVECAKMPFLKMGQRIVYEVEVDRGKVSVVKIHVV